MKRIFLTFTVTILSGQVLASRYSGEAVFLYTAIFIALPIVLVVALVAIVKEFSRAKSGYKGTNDGEAKISDSEALFDMNVENYVTLQEFSSLRNMDVSEVENMIEKGHFIAQKFDGQWYIHKNEID